MSHRWITGRLCVSAAILAAAAIVSAQSYIAPPSHTVPFAERFTRVHSNVLISAFPRVMPWHGRALPESGPLQGAIKGLYPADVRKAYGVTTPTSQGSHTILLITPYDYPQVLSDLNTFSQQFGLPQETSSDPLAASNKVLQIIYDQGTRPSDPPGGWDIEEACDVQWLHAMAPQAKIVVIEAQSDQLTDLIDSLVDIPQAGTDVREICMSWGLPEASGEVTIDTRELQPINYAVFFTAAGDSSGGATQYPATSPYAVGCGSTHLDFDSSGNVLDEVVWDGTSGGTSSVETRPSFQDGVQSIVGGMRGTPDCSALGDPGSGVAVYCTPLGGWDVMGGSNLAAVINTGIHNIRGIPHTTATDELTAMYTQYKSANIRDITQGSSGSKSASAGWDFCSGLGSPIGMLAPIGPPLKTLSVPTTMARTTVATGTVTIASAAPANGVAIGLSSNNTAGATVPGTVTIPQGATSADFTITSYNVPVDENVWVTAAEGASTLSSKVTIVIESANVTSLRLDQSAIVGGNPVSGTVTIDTAPSASLGVSFKSDNPAATVPSSTVQPGQKTASFTVHTSGVGLATVAHITANAGGTTQTTSLTIQSATLSGISVGPSKVTGGATSTGTVSLNGSGSQTGSAVYLTSANTGAVKVPADIVLTNSTGAFSIKSAPVGVPTAVTITATFKGIAKTCTFTVEPAALLSLAVKSSTVVGGNAESCALSLSGVAPSTGLAVKLTSSSAAAVPSSKIVVAGGQSSANFGVATRPVDALTAVTLTATLGSVIKQKTFSVLPASFSAFSLKQTSVPGGTKVIAVVSLNGAAGPSGVPVTATSSLTTAATVPATVSVPAGKALGEFYVTTLGQTKTESVTITAKVGKVTKSAVLTIQPTVLKALTPASTTVTGGQAAKFSVSLTGAAPAGGISLTLTSSDPTIIIPASPVKVAAGSSIVNLSWPTSSGVTTTFNVTIRAYYGGKTVDAVISVKP